LYQGQDKALEGTKMHSPFPGMDPYLEVPSIWPDVHTRLMSIVGEQLTPLLVPKYLAELETQVVIDHLDDDPQVVLPDVSVTSPDVTAGAPMAAAVAAPAPVQVRVPMDGPTRLVSVYIRQRETARLVAVIELLSPVNKRRGKGREEYLEKRRTFLTSPVHFIEIDLLRSYPRMPFDDPLPPAHYIVMVCKAGERPRCSVWPISVRQPLPTIPIPLLPPDPPVPLELGQALRTAYARARYDLRVEYRQPPIPPLASADAAWAAALIGSLGGRLPQGDR
jgi:Protein of unknown function (DUF4058)